MNSHIINGHYMFGGTFIQPEMAHYHHIAHHNLAPVTRPFPPYPDMNRPPMCPNVSGSCLCYEDCANKIDAPYTNPDDENADGSSCNDCPFKEDIIRDPLLTNVTNIETKIIKTLKVTLYGTNKDMDKTIEMKQGSRYAVTYITERGLMTSVGYLELISDSIPDTCVRYIGGTNSVATASTAYIGMDCSTEGHSDKRKIYIATIRYIKALDIDEEVEIVEDKSIKDRLQELLDAIDNGTLVFCDHHACTNSDNVNDSEHDSNESDDSEQDSDPEDGADEKI